MFASNKHGHVMTRVASFLILHVVFLLSLTTLFCILCQHLLFLRLGSPISVSVHNYLEAPLRCRITGRFLHPPPPTYDVGACRFNLSNTPSEYASSPWELRVLLTNPNDGTFFQLVQEPLFHKNPQSSRVRSCRWDIDKEGVHYTWFDGQENQLEETKTLCNWEILWMDPFTQHLPELEGRIGFCSSLASNTAAVI